MAGQTQELASETRVMRAFDAALQKAIALPPRARGRTLRHISERLTEQLEQAAAEMEEYAAGWDSGAGTSTSVHPGGGGNSSGGGAAAH